MVTMIFIGFFVAITRFIMQYDEVKGLERREQLRVGIIYIVGMIGTFMLGSYIIDWTKTIAIHSIVQTVIFIAMFTAIFFIVQQCMRPLLPANLHAEKQNRREE